MDSTEVLDREFLQIRARILEIAAALDRIDRAEGDLQEDHRMALIRSGIDMLSRDDVPERAAGVQMVFSLPYEANWREDFGI